MKLTIELVPMTTWGHNLRKILPRHDWEIIQQRIEKAQHGACAVCQLPAKLEAHEAWDYNDLTHVQTLQKVEGLCAQCHMVKHYDLAYARGKGAIVMAHFQAINKLTPARAVTLLEEAKELWTVRSRYQWTLDISWLTSQHIPIPEGYCHGNR